MGASITNSGGNRSLRPKFEREIEIEGSDLVRAVSYDPARWILDVTLMDGKRYRYQDIGPVTFSRLVTSKSAGKIFNAHIKHKSRVRKLPSVEPYSA